MIKILFLLFLLSYPFRLSADSVIAGPGNDHFQKAVAAMNEESLDEAEEEFKQALMLEPMNAEYHFELANLYAMRHDEFLQLQDEEGALEKLKYSENHLEQAVMTKPDFLAARFNLGVVYKKLGKYEDARAAFKEVLNMDPSQGQALLQIGATYEAQGFYDEAETIYQQLLERYPNHPELHNALRGLEESREDARIDEMAERRSRQMALGTGLSALSQAQGANAYNSPYGYGNQQPQSGNALPYLGSWALQQFMKRKNTTA